MSEQIKEEVKEEVKEEETTLVTEASEKDNKEKSAESIMYETEDEPSKVAEEKTEDSEDKVAASSEESKAEEDGEAKSKDEEKAEYELELMEDSYLDNSMVEGVMSLAKEHNLSKEQAQKILSKQDEAVKNWIDTQIESVEQQKATWKSQVESDKVLGGNNLDSTVSYAKGVVDKFANDEVRNILRETGYGNHPEIVRFLSKIGQAMGDDSLVIASAKESKPTSTEDLFYGSQN